MLTSQANQKSVTFFIIGIFLDKWFKFQSDVCSGCHDVLMMSTNLSDIATPNIHGADYRCVISGISKSEVINLMQNVDLSKKMVNYKL